MSDFDINQIRRLDGGLLLIFRELLRTGRATTAAQRLGLSASAISHALNRLRDLFGDPLFVRRPHGLEPTRRAIELGPNVEALLSLANETLSKSDGFDPSSSRRRFRFAAPEFVTALIGAELVSRLALIAPGVSFGVSFDAEEEAFRGLRTGEIDFALGRFGGARAGFVRKNLFADTYCVAARQGHPGLANGLGLEVWRQAGHVFAWSKSETAADKSETDSGDPLAMVAAVPQWMTALLIAAATDAVVTCPRRLAERYAARLGLQVFDPPFESLEITISVLRRSGVVDAGVDWFLSQVREVVAPTAAAPRTGGTREG